MERTTKENRGEIQIKIKQKQRARGKVNTLQENQTRKNNNKINRGRKDNKR